MGPLHKGHIPVARLTSSAHRPHMDTCPQGIQQISLCAAMHTRHSAWPAPLTSSAPALPLVGLIGGKLSRASGKKAGSCGWLLLAVPARGRGFGLGWRLAMVSSRTPGNPPPPPNPPNRLYCPCCMPSGCGAAGAGATWAGPGGPLKGST